MSFCTMEAELQYEYMYTFVHSLSFAGNRGVYYNKYKLILIEINKI